MSNELNDFRDWGPYLSFGMDASTEMRISWESKYYQTHRKLWYGTTMDCENLVENGWFSPTTHHCIVLTGLNPNTTYYYQIERNLQNSGLSKSESFRTEVFSFTTGPLPSNTECEYEFCVVGDIHASPQNEACISGGFDTMERLSPERAFTVVVGDSIDNGFKESHWQSFFKIAAPYLPNVPMMNVCGNHDCSHPLKYNKFIRTWDHPYANPEIGGFYTFRYGDALFVMADSDNAGTLGEMFSDDEFEWLEEVFEKAYEEKLWIFVFFHRQMYSTGDFSMNQFLHQFIRPLFDEYHVDCVFYGHDHNYQAFWCDKDSEWGGSKYLVCGGGGGQERLEVKIMGENKGETIYLWPGRSYIYERDGIPPIVKGATISQTSHRLDEILPSQLYAILEPNYVSVKIHGDQATIRCLGWQDQVFHELNFQKTKKD